MPKAQSPPFSPWSFDNYFVICHSSVVIFSVNLSPDNRIAGVLTPLFALRTPNDLGIGDVNALRQFIDWAAGIGFRLVQLLPINETGGDNSPYNAISSVALEPTTLYLAPNSPEDLSPEAYHEIVDQVDLAALRKGDVNYPAVRALKRQLLERAFVAFSERAQHDALHVRLFEEFCLTESGWLEDYVFFRALMEENNGSEAWDEWPEDRREMGAARAWYRALAPAARALFDRRLQFFRYVQWIAHGQWAALKHYAQDRNVALMGDIPFGVSYYSADVYAGPDRFLLDWSGGAPPEPYFKDDAFTQKWGQNWGIPLYNWPKMRERGFRWWRQRIRGVKNSFHVFRIDHVLGFYRIYAFPWRPRHNPDFLPLTWEEMTARTEGRIPHFAPRDDGNPENAELNRREGEEYLRVVLEEAGATRLVGEDLGTVPPYVRPNLTALDIAGFKIPQWETHQDGRVVPGNEYQRLSLATYATHDHKPIRALWHEAFEVETATTAQAREDLNRIAQFAGISGLSQPPDFDRDFYPAIMRALMQCNSWISVLMITDLLGRRDRFNVPGTATASNWTRRLHLTVPQLRTNRTVHRHTRLLQQLLEETDRL